MRHRIFIVVPIVAWADLLRERIERSREFQVVGLATDPARVPRELQRLDPPPDVVLLDIGTRMALRVAPALRRPDGSPRMVAVGFDEEPGQVIAWAMAGATGLVARTAPLDELVDTVLGVARGEARCSPAVSRAMLLGISQAKAAGRKAGAPVQLTERQQEVARLIADGCTNKEIATLLQIEPGTVKSHVHSVIQKLGVSRRAGVAGKLQSEGTAGVPDLVVSTGRSVWPMRFGFPELDSPGHSVS